MHRHCCQTTAITDFEGLPCSATGQALIPHSLWAFSSDGQSSQLITGRSRVRWDVRAKREQTNLASPRIPRRPTNVTSIIQGCSQAVRQQTLTLSLVGSNPAIPAKSNRCRLPTCPEKCPVRGQTDSAVWETKRTGGIQ